MNASSSVSDRAMRLCRGATEIGQTLSAPQSRELLRFLDLLVQWNRAYNLTAVRDPQEMVARHLLDSLTVRPFLFGDRILDLGTGAGLPGLPLALCEPGRRFWLLDGNGKKIRFVRQAAMELELANLESVHSRIEAYRPAGKFSTIVCRAVAEIREIRDLAWPLLASPGRLLIMKGRYPADELSHPALAELDREVHSLRVPFLEGERHLIEIRRE